jgi:hypothetical protein
LDYRLGSHAGLVWGEEEGREEGVVETFALWKEGREEMPLLLVLLPLVLERTFLGL